MKSLYIILTSLLLAGSTQAQLTATILKDATLPLEGCTYVLPKTILTATVTYKQVKQTPGPYAQYAERFLGLGAIIQNEQTTHELVSITLSSAAVADQTARYHVKPVDAKTPLTISLSPEGFLLGSNLNKEPLIARTAQPIASEKANHAQPTETMPESILTRDMQQATSTAKLAELAAAQIFSIRENRMSLLQQETEHTPSDGISFSLILEELNRMETYYMELFTGNKTSVILKKSVTFEPKREEEVVLFRFNQQNGLVDKNDLSGNPVSIKLTKQWDTELGYMKKREEKKPALPGIFYRIPCPTTVTIFDAQQTYVVDALPIPQLGSINILPVSMTRTFRLCPYTGALLEAGR